MLPSSLWCDLFLLTGVLADLLVAPRVVNSVNYDDYTLLCADGIPLLMEDHRPRPCQPRPWLREQKCPAGFWCHEGEDESSYYCCPANRKLANRCHLPPATGHGNKAMRRFYYDWTDDGCHELNYTGIGGNENSFTSYDQCEKACRGIGEPSVKFPKDANLLKNKKVNKSSTKIPAIRPKEGTRTALVSSTTASTPIAAVTMNALKLTTTIPAAFPTGSTTPRTSTEPVEFTTITSEIPEPITSPLTTGNELEDMTTRWIGTNPCELPMDAGYSGGTAQKMWYFDVSTMTCQPFTFLGSDGNANRYSSKQECQKVCGSGFSGKPSPAVCDLQPQFGNGTYKIPRYFYDQLTKHCELFFYSGEGGNENRFLRKQKCERYCLRKNRKYSTHAITTTMSTRPATRIVQELQASREMPCETSTTIATTIPPTQTTTQPAATITFTTASSTVSTESATEATTSHPYPTLITFPKEFIPPFPQFTFEPIDLVPTTTAPTPLNSEGPIKPNELVDSLFEHLMASTPPAPVFTSPTPSVESTKKSQFPSLIIVPKDWEYSKYSGSSEILGAATVTATPLKQYSLPWRIQSPFEKGIKPALPVMSVVQTRVETPMLPAYPVVASGASLRIGGDSNAAIGLPEGITRNSNGNANSLPKELHLTMNKGDHAGAISFSKPVYLVVNNNTSVGATLPRTDYLNVNNKNTDGGIMLPNPVQLSANSQAAAKLGPAQNAEWVGHGIRAYQQILQEKQRTLTSAPLAVQVVTNSDLITTTQTSIANPPATEKIVVPTMEIKPEDFAVHPAQPSSMESANSSGGSNNSLVPAVSPCIIPIFGNAVIMCELDEVTCPADTFCQIGEGQSICCPKPPEPKCSQALRPGVGASVLFRWHFNAETQLCLPFAFRGFQGNENNFATLASCKLACLAPKLCEGAVPVPVKNGNESCSTSNSCPNGYICKVSEDGNLSACCPEPVLPQKTMTPTGRLARSCLMTQDAGFGVESSHRWSFDPKSSKCVSFIYNGHGGNENNFLSRSDCESACKTADPCNEPVVSGTGNKFISKFFYSKEYGQCLHFVYSGEGGNSNNFANLQECMNTCMSDNAQFNSHVTINEPKFEFAFVPRPVCPHGDVTTSGGKPIACDYRRGTGCPTGNVCTSMDLGAYCCQAPETFCLQPRPALSVCLSPNSTPVQRIEFTYDPLADRCVKFNYTSCSPSLNLNHFSSSSQCKRLCCNQGYDLVYRKRLLHMNDSPMEVSEDEQRH
ncbi:unnamed protein product [Cylicocyclus nassatus]|uniref:BPTI/Kunitz inhibitor domain-containing protein n=1 Tax=Cylicocyclus nassatus TaxID=53992 RepID=A0AA36GGX3_CYLNA|nr:unnamed protein product [Cylicocyclus nassatus]